MSIYIILDTTHVNYRNTVSRLASISDRNFSPRPNLDKTKALIQIKDAVKFNRIDFGSKLGTLMIASGDAAWARTQARGPEWYTEED